MGGHKRSKGEGELARNAVQRGPIATPVRPSSQGAAGLLALQHAVGNNAVCRLTARAVVQPKLDVGPPATTSNRKPTE